MKRLSFGIVLALVLGVSTANANTVDRDRFSSPQASSNSSLLLTQKDSSGSFVAVEHPTQGLASVVEEDGVKYLQFNEDFQSDNGPALKVILHNSPTVGLKVQEGEYISLGALQSVSGSQRYQIPDEVDVSQYQSVAIWCERFNATFGYAPLNQ